MNEPSRQQPGQKPDAAGAADVERLVLRARRGDRRAFSRLVARFQKPVFYTVLKVVRDVHTADDLTQEVFVKAFCNLRRLRTASFFGTWLHRIALNKAIDHHRRAKKEADSVFLVDDFFNAQATRDGGAEGAHVDLEQLRARLREGIERLPEGQRLVLLMTMDQGLPQEEVAAVLSIPVGTVKSRLFHARRFLAAQLAEFL